MAWKTILTSGVVAAIVSGIFALIKQVNSNKARYVIEQREKWREKIRTIADEIYNSNEKTIGGVLVKLKTRINPYGKFKENVLIESHQVKNLKRKEKKDLTIKENTQEAYYLSDGHIWKIIRQIEKEHDFEKNKNVLIDYLTYLVKFDWERAKIESTINKKTLFSFLLEIFSFLLLLFNLSNLDWNNKNDDSIISIIVFIVIYALPILSIVLINSQSTLIKQNSLHSMKFVFLGSVIILSIILLISFFCSNNIMGWASILSLVSIVLLIAGLEDKTKIIKEYINDLEKIDRNLKKQFQNKKRIKSVHIQNKGERKVN